MDRGFYKNKNVLITGHTGFKGSWLSKILAMAGARVTGYALEPPGSPALYDILNIKDSVNSIIGDIRDYEKLKKTFDETKPEIVFHLAAQPIVIASYENPRYTYETNVLGTVNVLECARLTPCVKSVLNVTTDKVYKNNEWVWGYRENEPLDGFDPYSNSKSCSELATHSYKSSFFDNTETAVSTARAGNVIGGGDFAENRIIPDCVRAALEKKPVTVRNPNSVRPYQHVLEPLNAYITIACEQYKDKSKQGYYNVGPNEKDCLTTGELAEVFCETWGDGQTYECIKKDGPHEANFLKLDCSLLKSTFGWKPTWDAKTAVEKTVEWTKTYAFKDDIIDYTEKQIIEFFKGI